MFLPLAGEGADCWALDAVVATNTAAAKHSRETMFFSSLHSPFQKYVRAGLESDTSSSDRAVKNGFFALPMQWQESKFAADLRG
jgi:hypothetical protein